jgi:transcriptional regulator with XRE-family HTH domain
MVKMSSLAQRMRACREAKSWTQPELAKKAKVTQSFIGALEAGNQKTSGYLPEIAHALGVDAYWLKTGFGRAPAILGATTPTAAPVEPQRDLTDAVTQIAGALAALPEADRLASLQRAIAIALSTGDRPGAQVIDVPIDPTDHLSNEIHHATVRRRKDGAK